MQSNHMGLLACVAPLSVTVVFEYRIGVSEATGARLASGMFQLTSYCDTGG